MAGTLHMPPVDKWALFAPVLQSKMILPIGSCLSEFDWDDDIGQFLNEDRLFGAFWKLVRIPPRKNDTPVEVGCGATRSVTQGSKSSCALERLPEELVQKVMSYLLIDGCLDLPYSVSNVVALGYCSLRLRSSMINFARHQASKAHGCWADTPLFCLGLHSPSLPRDIESQANIATVLEITGTTSVKPPKFPWIVLYDSSMIKLELIQDVERSWRSAAWGQTWSPRTVPIPALQDISKARRRGMECDLIRALSIPGTEHHSDKWTLRNLTTKQFVRLFLNVGMHRATVVSGPLLTALFPHCVYVEGSAWLSLDAALLVKILWTGRDVRDPRPPKYGPWAGHRFEVTKDQPEGWQDVTCDVVEDAKSMGVPQAPWV